VITVARDVELSSVMTRCCAPSPRIRRRVVAPAIDGPRRGGQCHSERWLTGRSDPEKLSPAELGATGLAPLADAPGTYVFES
jgi:hypothetical protein